MAEKDKKQTYIETEIGGVPVLFETVDESEMSLTPIDLGDGVTVLFETVDERPRREGRNR